MVLFYALYIDRNGKDMNKTCNYINSLKHQITHLKHVPLVDIGLIGIYLNVNGRCLEAYPGRCISRGFCQPPRPPTPRSCPSWLLSAASSWPCPLFSSEPLGHPQVRELTDELTCANVFLREVLLVFVCVCVYLRWGGRGTCCP